MQTRDHRDTAAALSPEEARLTRATSRALKAPLGALRVLLEGAWASGESSAALPFVTRALEEVRRAEDAADDLCRWILPRDLHPTACTLGEIVQSLRESLDIAHRKRCHVVADGPTDQPLLIDGRMVVSSIARVIVDRLDDAHRAPGAELMLHVHADADRATLNLIDADAPAVGETSDGPRTLADALLERDIQRVGGTARMHESNGHRCLMVTVPCRPADEVAA